MSDAPSGASPGRRPARRTAVRALGFLGAGTAFVAALLLVLQHLGASALPGCGLDSACQRALGGPFGTLPGGWPLAFAGAAFFAGELAAWAASGAAWPASLRWLARFGGLLSVALLGLAFQQGTLCPYCLTAQVANLAFVLVAERAPRAARGRRAELAFGLTAFAATAALAVARGCVEEHRAAADEHALRESSRAIESGVDARPFTGRYRRGPERAAIRLVLFTDYQCPDCKRIENEAWALAEARADLALSIKHFPLCSDCNRRARELAQNPHPNACWAARAAEAAGIVAGEAGFWRMHRWLFARGGGFRDDELRAALPALELDPATFLRTLHAPETQARVEADVDEALALGIQSTPMIFVNGVELRGWRAPEALRRAVEALAASAPTSGGAELDRPPDALAKGLADWRAEPRRDLPARAGEEPRAGAPEIVLWSDYLEPSTQELDRRLRAFQREHPEVRYSFRHYPLDPACTPSAPASHPGACRAARLVEAARALDPAAGLRLHVWLMEQAAPLEDEHLRAGLRAVGLDAEALLAAAAGAPAAAAVSADVEAARRLGVRSIPFLFVAGRLVPRWRIEGVELLEPLLAEALVDGR